jgi:hypothetical protein
MIVWQGWGFLGLLIPVVLAAVMQILIDGLLGKGYYGAHSWISAAVVAVAAAIVWWTGSKLAKRAGRELLDPETGEKVLFKQAHTLFWIPLQYFGFVIAAIAIFMLFMK